MIHFTEGEWFYIEGRGIVFATKMPEKTDKLLNEEVRVQGVVYKVVGVEMQALNDTTLFKGREVGLLLQGQIKDA